MSKNMKTKHYYILHMKIEIINLLQKICFPSKIVEMPRKQLIKKENFFKNII